MSETTLIQNADWIVAWDDDKGEHVYLNGVDLAFEDDKIVYIGSAFEGAADIRINGRNLMVMPGLINVHSHPASEPMSQGYTDELGSPKLYHSALYEFMLLMNRDAEGIKAAAEVGFSESLKSGVTTLVDISAPYEGWLDIMAKSGLRGVFAPGYRSASWSTKNGHSVEYKWDEAAGRQAMERAIKLIDAAAAHPSGRFTGMLSPVQVDTCTENLLKDSLAVSQERSLPIQIHAAQSVVEFQEMVRRHGQTPIEWLDGLGLLTPLTSIGHAMFLDHTSRIQWHTKTDLSRLADNGTGVAHCPTVFSRRGLKLEHFGAYKDAGVSVGIGTDAYPHNMLEEMRHVIYFNRISSGQNRPLTSEVFNAATIDGARILNREDIGRLAVGTKADLVLVDLDQPIMKPCREPLRSLIFVAAERAIKDVYVDGRKVVSDSEVVGLDYPSAKQALHEAQARALCGIEERDWAGRSAEAISPLVFSRSN